MLSNEPRANGRVVSDMVKESVDWGESLSYSTRQRMLKPQKTLLRTVPKAFRELGENLRTGVLAYI